MGFSFDSCNSSEVSGFIDFIPRRGDFALMIGSESGLRYVGCRLNEFCP